LQESPETRPISILADLITPFVGGRALVAAHALLSSLGSLDRILGASHAQLLRACGPHADLARMIVAARMLVEAALSERVQRTRVVPSDANLHSYLITKMWSCPHEELHTIFTNSDDGFLAEEMVARGDQRAVNAGIQAILRRAIDLGATKLLLFHNHPSRQPQPSEGDILATRQIATAAAAVGITIMDHMIVAGTQVTSMRERGHM
jgi:DNA repair protein RadC